MTYVYGVGSCGRDVESCLIQCAGSQAWNFRKYSMPFDRGIVGGAFPAHGLTAVASAAASPPAPRRALDIGPQPVRPALETAAVR